MTVSRPRDATKVWMSGDYNHQDLQLERAVVEERISTLTRTQVQFVAHKTRLDLQEMVGKILTVHIGLNDDDQEGRLFTGTCVSVEAVASVDREDTHVAEVRPWFWMLTLTRNNRVYQNLTVLEIIEQVLDDHGQKAFLKISATASYAKREYCVQYRESDFAFLSRLMEEEGLYYYFDSSDAFMKNEKLVICDGTAGLGNLGGDDQVEFWKSGNAVDIDKRSIHEWSEKEAVVPGKVSLGDYDFEVPSVAQMAVSQDKRGQHGHNAYEYYDLPGHYRKEQTRGKALAAVRLGADSARFKEYQGLGNARAMASGHIFSLKEHPDERYNTDYLVTGAKHFITDIYDSSTRQRKVWLDQIKEMVDEEVTEEYSFEISAIKKEEQFRAPMVTPWPEVPGVQTGVVVGPSGKEIWTDKHGRVKVHFRWDRVNSKDETASCWIRVATGWSGNNWGLNSVPRIGQEVLIQFEDGDPDRPIVTGMLYNADTMPPYVDPGQPTRTGLMTRSSPNGGAKDFNAMVFEDKAGAEYMNVQAQKDYQFVVKDSAEIIIGDDSKNVNPSGQSADASSLKQTVKKNVTELVQEGDKSETIDKGDLELIVEGDRKETVRSGDMSLDVSKGNISVDAGMGKIDVSAAKTITLEAMQKITLKVGGSSIEITPTGVKIVGTGLVQTDSKIIQTKATGPLVLKGLPTAIN